MTLLSRRLGLAFALALSVPPVLAGCAEDVGGSIDSAEEPITTVSDAERRAAQRQDLGSYRYDALTPAGEDIMRASLWWMGVQDRYDRYPRPRMCATNVSKVLFLGGITEYDQEGVRNLIADVRELGGLAFKMPQSKSAFIEKLNGINGGHLPAGTLIAGMNVHTSAPGDQHIGFIGHTDRDGTVWIYHNNWYRPANEGGRRKPFMVSEENLRRGYERQFMATPWLRLERNSAGQVAQVTSLLPALDDMDPFNPNFQVTLAIPREIAQQL